MCIRDRLEYHLSEMGYTLGSNPKRKYWTIRGKGAFYSEKADAGKAILEACKAMTNPDHIRCV